MNLGGRRTAIVAVVLLAAASVAACGGDDGDVAPPASTTGSGGPTTVTATTVAATTTAATTVAATGTTTLGATTVTATGATATTAAASGGGAAPSGDQLRSVPLELRQLVDLPKLTSMAARPADGAMYFTSQTGEVWRFVFGSPPAEVLDLTAQVSPYENGSERGLLGIAFNPIDGRMFVYYTDANIDSHLVSYTLDAAGRPDPASAWEVLFVDQPGLGHKGGGLAFLPDGTLFLALGDGGGSNGRDAQDYSKLLGGVIRIVPHTDGPGYDVPPDNPFVGQAGTAPEIWAKGLRNPWGFCRDPATGDLWIGDVGNNTMEEVDRIPDGEAGLNFGWYFVEGTQVNHPGAPADAVAPVWAYRHDEVGPAIIGGCVYHGTQSPALDGAYVFADLSGPLFAIGANDEVVRLGPSIPGIATNIGVSADGELIVLTHTAGAFHLAPKSP